MVIESITFQNTYDSSSYFFRDKDFKNAFKYFLFSKKYLRKQTRDDNFYDVL